MAESLPFANYYIGSLVILQPIPLQCTVPFISLYLFPVWIKYDWMFGTSLAIITKGLRTYHLLPGNYDTADYRCNFVICPRNLSRRVYLRAVPRETGRYCGDWWSSTCLSSAHRESTSDSFKTAWGHNGISYLSMFAARSTESFSKTPMPNFMLNSCFSLQSFQLLKALFKFWASKLCKKLQNVHFYPTNNSWKFIILFKRNTYFKRKLSWQKRWRFLFKFYWLFCALESFPPV